MTNNHINRFIANALCLIFIAFSMPFATIVSEKKNILGGYNLESNKSGSQDLSKLQVGPFGPPYGKPS
ncbi:hypothetical protein H0X48_02680 [Candidatus Dependentiae bacterium]|nr:hypothetical protein [Candidatus Dependentiae bacterium]